MAIAFDAATNGGDTTGTSLTFSFTLGASADFLAVAFVGDVDSGTDDVSSVTYNGVAMTLARKANLPASSLLRWTYVYYLLAPATGAAHDVVITFSSSHNIHGCAASYSGVLQGALDAVGDDTSPSSTTSFQSSITSVADNCWAIFAASGYDNGDPPLAGTGLTRRCYTTTAGQIGLFDSNAAITPAGSFSGTTQRTNPVNPIRHVMLTMAPSAASFAPSAGSITLTGTQPTIIAPRSLEPAAGTITLAGTQPIVTYQYAGLLADDATGGHSRRRYIFIRRGGRRWRR